MHDLITMINLPETLDKNVINANVLVLTQTYSQYILINREFYDKKRI